MDYFVQPNHPYTIFYMSASPGTMQPALPRGTGATRATNSFLIGSSINSQSNSANHTSTATSFSTSNLHDLSKTNAANSLLFGALHSQRPNKPQPLRISMAASGELPALGGAMAATPALNGVGVQHVPPPISTDELLILMNQINIAVKSSLFNSQLASNIFRLYNELKNYGDVIEQMHKDELNRVFVSLRQAGCRDSGQLGTPCRLKIMELIELRAMGWRPSLAHSQYYIGRAGQTDASLQLQSQSAAAQQQQPEAAPEFAPAPVSAPPFGAIPINPFGYGAVATAPAQTPSALVPNAAELVSSAHGLSLSQPQYYLIPASTVAHSQAGLAFVQSSSAAAALMQPPGMSVAPSRVHAPLTGASSLPVSPPQSVSPTSMALFPKGAVMKPSGKFAKPTKVQGKNQFKDEVVIRNVDSGKIMGIKGRRVAIIEEISKTVISFQKVPSGAKERMLTITGPSEQHIQHAKQLIDQTIRRNASPNRADGDADHAYSELSLNGSDADLIGLSCTDPALLQVAKEALKEYFERHSQLRRSYTDGTGAGGLPMGLSYDERKERRKSMPPPLTAEQRLLISAGRQAALARSEQQLLLAEASCDAFAAASAAAIEARRSSQHYLSTPNLLGRADTHCDSHPKQIERCSSGDSNLRGGGDGLAVGLLDSDVLEKTRGEQRSNVRVVYTREFLLKCSLSPLCFMSPPAGMATIASDLDDILRPNPGMFDPAEYKQLWLALKTPQAAAASLPLPGQSGLLLAASAL